MVPDDTHDHTALRAKASNPPRPTSFTDTDIPSETPSLASPPTQPTDVLPEEDNIFDPADDIEVPSPQI
eukprot:2947309-Pyramimonas_sp.AAC.2